jgi:hypothetical protein
MSEQGYRVPEVCRIVGITYRQLDYWARTELVTPSIRDATGSGSQRLYEADSPEAVVDLLRQGQGVFAIAVDRVWEDVEKDLAKAKRGSGRRRVAAGGT